MKDKSKRDKDLIEALQASLDRVHEDKNGKDKICRGLIALCISEGVETHKIFEVVEDDHFLRKLL